MEQLLFYFVILFTNIIQGITGFAGTILAMPFSIMLIGYGVAKPILNVLGIFAGIYVFAGNIKFVNKKELLKIIIVMGPAILAGTLFQHLMIGKERILYKLLGIFVISIAIQRLILTCREKTTPLVSNSVVENIKGYGYLISAGIVHGMFVSGGPLLIGYLSKKIQDNKSFRATVSGVWIVLNSLVLFTDIKSGYWNRKLLNILLFSIVFLFSGMIIGSILFKHMSKKFFLLLTYVLLLISGVTLILK